MTKRHRANSAGELSELREIRLKESKDPQSSSDAQWISMLQNGVNNMDIKVTTWCGSGMGHRGVFWEGRMFGLV